MNYATVTDIQELKRPLSLDEQIRAGKLIPIICTLIRVEAQRTGRDFDKMIVESDLVPVVDIYEGDGEKTEFTLSCKPCGLVVVTIDGDLIRNGYTTDGNKIVFASAPLGEILVMYDYRALAEVAKAVVADVVMRELNTPGNQLPATSYSESAGSVSQSYSLPNASGAIKLWNSDLKALGLKRQKVSTIDLRGC